MTREQWLTELVQDLAAYADEIGINAGQHVWGEALVSCGYGFNKARTRLFDTIPAAKTLNKKPQIYISPQVCTSSAAVEALFSGLAALTAGTHKTNTKDFNKSLETLAALLDFAGAQAQAMGDYPQPGIAEEDKGDKETQTQALLKVSCACTSPDEKPYVVRITPKQAERGLPLCPFCCAQMSLEEKTSTAAGD